MTEATQYEQAEHGKTELSLVHFSVSIHFTSALLWFPLSFVHKHCILLQIRNPTWKPTEHGAQFISTIRENGWCELLVMFLLEESGF